MEAAQRRQEREAQRQQRELARRTKEQAKLSAIEQARLEVETFENQLELLLSIHKEQGQTWDWHATASSLPEPCPQRGSWHEYRAKQRATVLPVLPAYQEASAKALVTKAKCQDEEEFLTATKAHAESIAEWERLRSLARRILAGEHKAYTEALVELNPFAELSELGSAIHFTVHTVKLAECVLKVNGRQAIPTVMKTLTSSGKVSVKPMPKGRFHEIYQDYLCGCVLRVTREIFALLPLDGLLVTAVVDSLDPRAGQTVEQPVLSVFMPRPAIAQLNFDRLDPSDALETFQHRGDFKMSRKSEAFQPIIPLTPLDIPQVSPEGLNVHDLLASVRRTRQELKSSIHELSRRANDSSLLPDPSL